MSTLPSKFTDTTQLPWKTPLKDRKNEVKIGGVKRDGNKADKEEKQAEEGEEEVAEETAAKEEVLGEAKKFGEKFQV